MCTDKVRLAWFANLARALRYTLSLGLISALAMILFSTPARADTCVGACTGPGIAVEFQGSNTFLEHAADLVNKKGLPYLQKYVPTARPFNLNRPEYLTMVSLNYRLTPVLLLRVYGGFYLEPSKEVYKYSGDGQLGILPIGTVDIDMHTQGNLFVYGVDLLYHKQLCNSVAELVAGGGLSAMNFDGNITAGFTPLILGNTPFATIHATYWGYGGLLDAIAGFRLNLFAIKPVKVDFFRHISLMLLGGYRGGAASLTVKTTEIKDANGTSAMPIYGPFGQASLGWDF